MKTKCAIEKKTPGGWVPVAIRYYRFRKSIKRDLDRGETVTPDGVDFLRRVDWAERRALARAVDQIKGGEL